MSIVTISRQLGSLDTKIAEGLSAAWKLRIIGKAEIEKRLLAFNVPEKNIEKFDEKKPGFWDTFSTDRDVYLNYLKATIFEIAHEGNCIFLGRGAGFFLKDVPGVLRLRIVAPDIVRVERTKEVYQCDNHHANRLIARSDRERAGFHRFFFDADWNRTDLYDLVVNTGSLPPELVVEAIRRFGESEQFRSLEEKSAAQLNDLILAQRIVTKILYEKKLLVRFFEIKSDGGKVTLEGVTEAHSVITAAEAAAREVEGVREVVNKMVVVLRVGS